MHQMLNERNTIFFVSRLRSTFRMKIWEKKVECEIVVKCGF